MPETMYIGTLTDTNQDSAHYGEKIAPITTAAAVYDADNEQYLDQTITSINTKFKIKSFSFNYGAVVGKGYYHHTIDVSDCSGYICVGNNIKIGNSDNALVALNHLDMNSGDIYLSTYASTAFSNEPITLNLIFAKTS